MTAAFPWILISGAVLAGGAYLFRMRAAGEKISLALLGIALAAVIGIDRAKAGYFLLMLDRDGPERAVALAYDKLSIVCGAAGALAGIALSALLVRPRRSPAKLMDLFAPCGALMLAFCRAAEYFCGTLLGAGKTYLEEGHFLARFPLGIQNQWGDWFAAVCTLETALTLGVAAFFFLRKNRRGPGALWEEAAFALCLNQILLESLRDVCMKWGFVRVEQLLCAAVVMGLLISRCIRSRGVSPFRRWYPAGVALLCVAGLTGMEFAVDKGLLWLTRQLTGLPARMESPYLPGNTVITYALMILFLAVIAWMEGIALRQSAPAGGRD